MRCRAAVGNIIEDELVGLRLATAGCIATTNRRTQSSGERNQSHRQAEENEGGSHEWRMRVTVNNNTNRAAGEQQLYVCRFPRTYCTDKTMRDNVDCSCESSMSQCLYGAWEDVGMMLLRRVRA